MVSDPTVTFKLPPDYLVRFPDGDYTIGRGADPRSGAERAADPDGAIATSRPKGGGTKGGVDRSATDHPREAAE